MNLTLGRRLKIRSMVHVAGEPIPSFWPMRTFIHHNPLSGLEHLDFEVAVAEGERLFHARGYLPRSVYQTYLAAGKVNHAALAAQLRRFLGDGATIGGLDLHALLWTLMTETGERLCPRLTQIAPQDLYAALCAQPLAQRTPSPDELAAWVRRALPSDQPVYLAVDTLFGTGIGATLDELVVKSCLDFLDEGQSAWQMPGREKGLFAAWSALARHNLRLFIRGLSIKNILAVDDTPEGVISYVMNELGVAEDDWMAYFTHELTRLHGWSGFIRWRSTAKHYHWQQAYPADLVDYLAIRLVLGLALLREHAHRRHIPANAAALAAFIAERPEEAWLRLELYGGDVLPAMAHAVEDAVEGGKAARVARLLPGYVAKKREHEAATAAASLRQLAERTTGSSDTLQRLTADEIGGLCQLLTRFEVAEGQLWLNAHEAQYMRRLFDGLDLSESPPREKRPFSQVLFCIDVRSERIRRHLEKVGDYQTFGIAGFFGVPASFVGLDKGSETHLCPVVVTPKNLVLELAIARNADDEAFVSVLEQVFHDLKTSVLSPFITVEAIGLLFGLDMFGKSLAPLAYNHWRQRLLPDKPDSRLLLDKLSLEQADSIIRSLQRAMIVQAVGRELGLAREAITDEMVRELRECALGNIESAANFASSFNLDAPAQRRFLERLQRVYRINPRYARLQLERLGRIGYTLDEQVHFVHTALRSIGMTGGYSRFVILAGHGSTSENNPYESALDCGACGGNHGIVSARVLAQIANRPVVRERLRDKGIVIADDAWFIPAFHNTTTDELRLYDLDLLPPGHLIYVERLSNGMAAASRLCATERLRTLDYADTGRDTASAYRLARRNAMDWSQVRPEWGLSGNAAFVIGRRHITERLDMQGRVFLHSYDYRHDRKGRLLENILTGPLVVGQWINMEHYFSTVDNQHYGSGSKVYHNVAGRFGVMTGNFSDLRTGLPSQTVEKNGVPYHEPLRLLTVIEAPFEHAKRAIDGIVKIKNLVQNGWLRMAIVDSASAAFYVFEDGDWQLREREAVSPDGVQLVQI
jgi:uncharacterized protein YbcC (UPF0753/DUF2309 family)